MKRKFDIVSIIGATNIILGVISVTMSIVLYEVGKEGIKQQEIEIVNNYIRDEIQKLNAEPDNTSMIGALIKYDDKMYYIYEENETIAFVYRVYPYGDKIEDFACVRVKNGLYKTKFEFLEISKENFVKFEDMAADYRNAVISVEDHRFYDHGPVDFIAIGRAIFTNVKNKELQEGGSTGV